MSQHIIGKDVEKEEHSLLLRGFQTNTTTLEIILVVPQTIRNSSTLKASYTTPGHMLKRCSTIPQGHILYYVHSDLTHNSQELETTQMPFNRRVDTENVVHLYNGIPLSY